MRNFLRALGITLKYKWNIAGIIVSSLLLALCWGGNIATVYPLVQVSFQGDTIRSWLEKEIAEQEALAQKLREEARDLDANPSAPARLKSAEKTLKRYETIRPLVNRWTPNDPFLVVVLLMGFVAVATLVKSVCTFVHAYLSSRIGQLGAFELRSLFFRKMLGYEANYFSGRGIADATSRFTSDMGALSNGLTLVYGKALREPLKMIVCLVGAAIVSWQLLLFTFLFVPIAAVLIRWLAKSLKRVVRRAMIQMAQLYDRFYETFRAVRVVKSFNREGYEIAKFREANKTFFKRSMKTAKYDAVTSPLTECLGIGMLALAIVAGAYLVIYGKTSLWGIPTSSRPLDLGSLILFYGFLIGASDPARRLTDIFTSVQTACAAADRVYEMIDREPVVKELETPKRLERFQKALVFDNVSYEYPSSFAPTESREIRRIRFEDFAKDYARRLIDGALAYLKKGRNRGETVEATSENPSAEIQVERPVARESRRVLKNVSLTINFGETVAILGRSGCGKSTLTSMIPRFIDPIEGRVLMDDAPLDELRIADVREQIGLVSQDSILFNDTVFENVRYGRPTATREEVLEAARDAFADDFIREELTNGYDTIVGPGGSLLSGGQRQRIALARAILKNPRILLLDEATSQIDLQSERYIHRALKKFVNGRTTIMVTHRLGAIQLADRIVVMSDGIVEFVGTHEEAMRESAFYADLWKSEKIDEDADLSL